METPFESDSRPRKRFWPKLMWIAKVLIAVGLFAALVAPRPQDVDLMRRARPVVRGIPEGPVDAIVSPNGLWKAVLTWGAGKEESVMISPVSGQAPSTQTVEWQRDYTRSENTTSVAWKRDGSGFAVLRFGSKGA